MQPFWYLITSTELASSASPLLSSPRQYLSPSIWVMRVHFFSVVVHVLDGWIVLTCVSYFSTRLTGYGSTEREECQEQCIPSGQHNPHGCTAWKATVMKQRPRGCADNTQNKSIILWVTIIRWLTDLHCWPTASRPDSADLREDGDRKSRTEEAIVAYELCCPFYFK